MISLMRFAARSVSAMPAIVSTSSGRRRLPPFCAYKVSAAAGCRNRGGGRCSGPASVGGRPMPATLAEPRPAPSPSRPRRPAASSSATATASSIRAPSAASSTRPRSSSSTRATITARGSPIRSRSARSPARSPARSALDEDLAEALALSHDLGHTPFGHTGEDALAACMARVRRLRPQRPGASARDPARAALRRVRRAQPHLGDARRASSSTTARCSTGDGAPGAALRRNAACRSRSSNTHAQQDLGALDLRRRPRRRRRRSPTTSPTMPMTSTTACGPGCSRSTTSRKVRVPAPISSPRSTRRYPGPRAVAPHPRARRGA